MIQARIRKVFTSGFTLEAEFQAAPGITALLGPAGAGKTLILDAIAGFVRPSEGRILVDDRIVFDAAARVCLPPRARRCGYLAPGLALFPHLTVRQNLTFAVKHRPRLERHRRVNDALERYALTESAGQRPAALSGSERVRLAVARALIGQPRALLVDDAAAGLEAPLRVELYKLLRQARADHDLPVLVATRSLEECFDLSDTVLVLREGRLLQCGAPRAVLERPVSLEAARTVGAVNLLLVEIAELDPQRNTSRLRWGEHVLTGTYFPGKLRGDRVWVCVCPDQLLALPREGKPGPNQAPLALVRTVDRPHSVRLEFAGQVAVEVPRPEFERQKRNREWVVEFPPQALRVL